MNCGQVGGWSTPTGSPTAASSSATEYGQTNVDGPYTETKEMVGGFYTIEASNGAEAAEIAGVCPGLDHGSTVEVRVIWV